MGNKQNPHCFVLFSSPEMPGFSHFHYHEFDKEKEYAVLSH